MKISRIYLENFKRFGSLEIDLINPSTHDISNQFLILGDNGTGKTTVLQAVGLCLSLATGIIRNVEDFKWIGWIPSRYERWGKPIVELDIHFSDAEVQATLDAWGKWYEYAKPSKKIPPAENLKLTIRLAGGKIEVFGENGKPAIRNLYQLKGRIYATQLLKTTPSAREFFPKLPGFFWFDQFRNLASPKIPDKERPEANEGMVTFDIGVSRLRRFLNTWKMNQLIKSNQPGRPHDSSDWLQELENSYKKLFPGRCFSTLEPMYNYGSPAPEEYFFMLSDGNKTYDIEEMSAGEQSVFPILLEFVRMQIRNSVVLIDEVDLNLHPNLAQGFYSSLTSIGPECQFLLTTHSESISSISDPDEIYRLPGGHLCL